MLCPSFQSVVRNQMLCFLFTTADVTADTERCEICTVLMSVCVVDGIIHPDDTVFMFFQNSGTHL